MATSLRSVFIGILFAALILGGYRAFEWKRSVDSRLNALQARVLELEKSAVAYQWLAEGVVTLPDGKKVSRAQLLDLLLAKAVKPNDESSHKAPAR